MIEKRKENKIIKGLINFIKFSIGRLTPPIAPSPYEVIFTENKVRVLRYKPLEKKNFLPLLLLPSMVNRYYIFDLVEGNSIVQRFLKRGFEVFLLDWGAATREDKNIEMKKYFIDVLRRGIKKIFIITGKKKLSILGYCMGGTIAIAYSSLFPEDVENIILLATPINFEKGGKLALWADKKYFDIDRFLKAYGNAPPKILHSAFGLLKPTWTVKQWKIFFSFLYNDEFLKNFLSLSKWVNDNVEIPGKVFKSFVKDFYQENLLLKNLLKIDEKNINLDNIRASVLSVIAKYDFIVPPPACMYEVVFKNSKDFKTLVFDCAHVALSVGIEAEKIVFLEIISWLEKRASIIHN